MTSITKQTHKSSITIIAVVHDDVPKSTAKTIYADYFRPLVSELESFTERKVNVVFTGGEPYNKLDYRGDDTLKTLRRWEALGYELLHKMEKEGLNIDGLTKVILVTNDPLNDTTAGAALCWPPASTGRFAIASLRSYLYVGHEVGHLLGAKHEDFEVQYNGWWAETYMAPKREMFRSISYTFSPANRQNIKNNLADKD